MTNVVIWWRNFKLPVDITEKLSKKLKQGSDSVLDFGLDESETVKSKKKVLKKDELCGTCKPARKLKRFKQYLKAEYGK